MSVVGVRSLPAFAGVALGASGILLPAVAGVVFVPEKASLGKDGHENAVIDVGVLVATLAPFVDQFLDEVEIDSIRYGRALVTHSHQLDPPYEVGQTWLTSQSDRGHMPVRLMKLI